MKALIKSLLPKAAKGEANIPIMDKDMVDALLEEGDCYRMDIEVAPKFKVGDRIRVLDIRPEGHTRLTRYIRGKAGVIMRDHGVYPFPDTTISGDTNPQHVYSVQFDAREVWGERAPATDSLRIDLWDDYMVSVE